jgi:hypothetical protein
MNCTHAFFLIVALGLAGCATPQPPDFTIRDAIPVKNKQEAELRSITVVYDADAKISVDMTYLARSNVDTASLWKEGLTDALNRTVVFQDDKKLKVSLSVRIAEIKWGEGLVKDDLIVIALYEVIDRATGKILFEENIKGNGSLSVSDVFLGEKRIRMMFEIAVRENIKSFINTVSEINLAER